MEQLLLWKPTKLSYSQLELVYYLQDWDGGIHIRALLFILLQTEGENVNSTKPMDEHRETETKTRKKNRKKRKRTEKRIKKFRNRKIQNEKTLITQP